MFTPYFNATQSIYYKFCHFRSPFSACPAAYDSAGHPTVLEHPQDLLLHSACPTLVEWVTLWCHSWPILELFSIHFHFLGRCRGYPFTGEQRRSMEVGHMQMIWLLKNKLIINSEILWIRTEFLTPIVCTFCWLRSPLLVTVTFTVQPS